MGCVYQIKNLITNQIYIGSGKDFKDRKRRHLNDLKKNRHINAKLQNSWNKYGSNNFSFTILFETDNLLEDEQVELNKLNWKECFNICRIAGGGDQISYREDYEEIKKKISETHRKNARIPDNAVKISINNKEYDSYHSASKELDVPVVTIRYRCLSKNKKFKDWLIIGEKPTDYYQQGDNQGTTVLYGNTVYPSYAEAARLNSLSVTAIINRCKSKKYPDWSIIKA